MIIKVCGMRQSSNVADVCELGIDMIGFILYDKSPRYIGCSSPATPKGVKRVGVFVNSPLEHILEMVKHHDLDFTQLHGCESVELCCELQKRGIGVVKAISVASADDILKASEYEKYVDYLLFDTKCSEYGGSGRTFDWEILDNYRGDTPFLLSGGIDENMGDEIAKISHKSFAGVDLNSRFEDAPAQKNIEKLKTFIKTIDHE